MNLRLKCTEGPRKGEEFNFKDVVTLGRSTGDIQLRDPKASNQHCKIYSDDSGLPLIEDAGSSNGTGINGKKINGPTRLQSGDRINIGKTELVIEILSDGGKALDSEKGSWQELVELAVEGALEKAKKKRGKAGPLLPFETPIALDFVQGIQLGQTTVFGFGPRGVGGEATECLLNEEGSPALAFELYPVKDGLAELRSDGKSIKVNDAFMKKGLLKNGDRISLGQTVILVRAFKL